MRSRVAFTAALVSTIVLIALIILNCAAIANERNEELSARLEISRNLIMNSALSAQDSEGFTALGQYLDDQGIRVGIFDEEFGVIFASDESARSFDEHDLIQVEEGNTSVYDGMQVDGDTVLCVAGTLEDGTYIKLFHSIETFRDTLGEKRSTLYGIAFMVLGVLVCCALMIVERRRFNSTRRIMNALDSFSDGRFDARISTRDGFDRDTAAEYNAILSRIDERIFNQRSRNQALSVVMNQMQNGIIAVDDKLRVILVTPVAKRLLGITGNAQGTHITDASRDVRLDQVFSDAMQQVGVYTNEVAARTALGRGHRPLRLYVSPMRKEDRVVGALAMVEDITELKRLEQVRTDFAANVSHELKTPLTSIKGFVETLLDGAIENTQMARKFLNIIMLESERLTRLINDILSISKLESGMDEAPKERLRLDKEAREVVEMLEIHAKEKGVTVKCQPTKYPIYILANKDHLEQMLMNLIENGIKYNKPDGSVTVQVFANDTSANISIADTGIGIADEHLPRMFERFYRVDKGRSRSMGGTGLGLAIVKHIVRTMHGDIEVHSKLGEGTEFLVTIPLAASTDEDDINNDDVTQEED